MREWLEYAPVWLLAKFLGLLPRSVARAIGTGIGRAAYWLHPRLRRVGMRNLELAVPELPHAERPRVLQGVFTTLGRQLADFALLPRMTSSNVSDVVTYCGLEHYLEARARGRGVLFVTAHLGGWEIGSYAHALYGHPIRVVIRQLDNRWLNRFVDGYRTAAGNQTFGKQDFARGLLAAMRAGETVGILMDTNMTPPQGVFVPFFGIPACTASGLARVAWKTDAAVVPGFTVWHADAGKYCIHFEPPIQLARTSDEEQDAIANTALFTSVIERYVSRHPDQWLWVHRRWKSRPPGETPLY